MLRLIQSQSIISLSSFSISSMPFWQAFFCAGTVSCSNAAIIVLRLYDTNTPVKFVQFSCPEAADPEDTECSQYVMMSEEYGACLGLSAAWSAILQCRSAGSERSNSKNCLCTFCTLSQHFQTNSVWTPDDMCAISVVFNLKLILKNK